MLSSNEIECSFAPQTNKDSEFNRNIMPFEARLAKSVQDRMARISTISQDLIPPNEEVPLYPETGRPPATVLLFFYELNLKGREINIG